MAEWTTVKTEIFDLLVADSTYLTNMDDPVAPAYRTFYERNPEVPTTFPYVVYEIEDVIQSQEHGRTLLVSSGNLAFGIWSKNSAKDFETISDRIVFLLHQKASESGWRAILAGMIPEVYDEEFDAHMKRVNFVLWNRTAII